VKNKQFLCRDDDGILGILFNSKLKICGYFQSGINVKFYGVVHARGNLSPSGYDSVELRLKVRVNRFVQETDPHGVGTRADLPILEVQWCAVRFAFDGFLMAFMALMALMAFHAREL
jgi:hypothetical protein